MCQLLMFGILNVGLLLVGCTHTRDVVSSSTAATTLSPVVSSYGVADGANNLSQSSALVLGANPETFSTEIDLSEMYRLSQGYDISGLWVRAEWKYMGTKYGHHFFAYYPGLVGMRKIYRVPEQELMVESSFALTSDDSAWRVWHLTELPFLGNMNVDLDLWQGR